MNKQEILDLMLDTFQHVNRVMAEQMGMDEETIQSNLDQSRPSIEYMLSEVYNVLVANGIIGE